MPVYGPPTHQRGSIRDMLSPWRSRLFEFSFCKIMACNCKPHSPLNEENLKLPTLLDEQARCVNCETTNTSGIPCVDSYAVQSKASCGTELDSKFTDAGCDTQKVGITILGRIGRALARFSGNGFIQIINGKAFVVQSIPLKAITLWHNWFRPTTSSLRPILGEPLPFKNLVIGGEKGDFHLIRGPETEDAIPHWDAENELFEIKPVSEIEKCVKGQIAGADFLELVGYEAISVSGEPDAVRCMKKLSGAGILIAKQVATTPSECVCEGCEPVAAVATVFQFLPNPTTGTNYKLRYSVATGLHSWVADP